MIKIRNSVFETNSSSSHSIVIADTLDENKLYTREEALEELDADGLIDHKTDKIVLGKSVDAGNIFSNNQIICDFKSKMIYALCVFLDDASNLFNYFYLKKKLEEFLGKPIEVNLRSPDPSNQTINCKYPFLGYIYTESSYPILGMQNNLHTSILDFILNPKILLYNEES